MGAALVFNVNATPAQTTEAQAFGGNIRAIIPSSAGATQGMQAPTMSIAKTVSTTGLFIAGYAVKQTASIVTQNVSKITGNSHLQKEVNSNIKFAATAVGLFTHPIVTSMALAADGINYAINNFYIDSESKARSAQAQAKAGTLAGRKN